MNRFIKTKLNTAIAEENKNIKIIGNIATEITRNEIAYAAMRCGKARFAKAWFKSIKAFNPHRIQFIN